MHFLVGVGMSGHGHSTGYSIQDFVFRSILLKLRFEPVSGKMEAKILISQELFSRVN